MTSPKVSVLMPVRDTHGPWLQIAIAGIAKQSYENLDLVICDDGSTKATTIDCLHDAVERCPDRVFLFRNGGPNHGTAHALDICLSRIDPSTCYLSKADSDDIFHPDREANRVKLFETLPPQVAIVYDNFFQLNYEPRPHLQPIILRPYDYRALLNESYIPGNSMWRASVFESRGGWVKDSFVYDGYEGKANKHGEDYNLWLSITDKADGFWYNQDPSYTWTYRVYRDSKYMKDRKGVDYCRTLLQTRAKERRGLL